MDLLFPKRCVGCGKLDSYFCKECIANIKQGDLVCPRCERAALGGQTHPVCRRKFGLDGLWSLGIYQDPLRAAIQKLKYKWVKNLAEVVIDILIEYWAKFEPFLLDEIKKDHGKGWVIVPVPLFWWRRNDRGFNQSELLGQILSKKLGLDYCEALKRIRYTRSQTKLKVQQRRKNVKDAFALSPDYQLPATNCLLIDDVWTTGATLRECCYVLKRAGAKKVWALTLAR